MNSEITTQNTKNRERETQPRKISYHVRDDGDSLYIMEDPHRSRLTQIHTNLESSIVQIEIHTCMSQILYISFSLVLLIKLRLNFLLEVQKEVIDFILIRNRLRHTLSVHAAFCPTHQPRKLVGDDEVSGGLESVEPAVEGNECNVHKPKGVATKVSVVG